MLCKGKQEIDRRVDNVLDRGTSVYSTLDMKAGYWQIELHPSAREKSAFVTHNGLYDFFVSFGLKNSGASFQRLMGHILKELKLIYR